MGTQGDKNPLIKEKMQRLSQDEDVSEETPNNFIKCESQSYCSSGQKGDTPACYQTGDKECGEFYDLSNKYRTQIGAQ